LQRTLVFSLGGGCGVFYDILKGEDNLQFNGQPPWPSKARSLPKDQFTQEVERELTGRESEPWEIIYFKLYQTQILIIQQAIETAALMLGTDKSRGYCMEMICADFPAGTSLNSEDPSMLLQSMSRFFKFLPGEQRQAFLQEVTRKAS
jgi:hypothetical protein